MNDGEIFQFMQVFRSVTRVFPLRGDENELQDVGASYFKAMRRFTLNQVREGADRVIQRCKRFPRPAEWIDLVPRPSTSPTLLELAADERADYLEAVDMSFERPSCDCAACVAHGVNHQPQRFVPDDPDPHGPPELFEPERGRIGDQVVTRGHWAHGHELAGYYRAKAEFWQKARALGYSSRLLNPPSRHREPGMEG